jgi:hypothetical protein
VSKLVFAFSKATRSLRGQIVIQDPINNFGKINQLQGFHMHAFFTGSVAVGVYHTYDGSFFSLKRGHWLSPVAGRVESRLFSDTPNKFEHSHLSNSQCWKCGKRQSCCHLFCSECGKIQPVGTSCCNYFKLLDM